MTRFIPLCEALEERLTPQGLPPGIIGPALEYQTADPQLTGKDHEWLEDQRDRSDGILRRDQANAASGDSQFFDLQDTGANVHQLLWSGVRQVLGWAQDQDVHEQILTRKATIKYDRAIAAGHRAAAAVASWEQADHSMAQSDYAALRYRLAQLANSQNLVVDCNAELASARTAANDAINAAASYSRRLELRQGAQREYRLLVGRARVASLYFERFSQMMNAVARADGQL